VSRTHLPSLVVLAGAIAAGAAAFLMVGRMAGALYGAAAVILGLIFQQKLARGHRRVETTPDTPPEAPAASGRRPRLQIQLPRGRKAALRDELARVTADFAAGQKASTELARQLDDQRERTRELQASFAERVSELTHSLDVQSLELSSERAAHAERETALDRLRQQVAAFDSELGRTQHALAEREAALAERTRQLEAERLNARQLAERLTDLTASYREELARLAWSWRAHVEEIAALEAAVDAAVRMS
jgi:predicted  nucleic acid-binding Zn-ribbon protein